MKIAPHGNSKGGESYVRTMPSVLTKLKSTAAEKTAKRALAFMAQEAGGVESAHSASALPRGRQQVDDIRRASHYYIIIFCIGCCLTTNSLNLKNIMD